MDGAALGFRSELIFHRFDGEVIDRRAEDGLQVFRTPSNPGFFWGNFLLFDRAPAAGDLARWEALFARWIATPLPQCTHRAYGWMQDEPGEVDAFLAAGFTRNDTCVLQAGRLPPAPPPRVDAQLRAFDGDADWAAQLAADVAQRDPAYGEDSYRAFCEGRNARWRRMIDAGRGQWFGAFVERDGEPCLAASLGVFGEADAEATDGERIARFQWVSTQPAFQRLGLCRALLAHAGAFACDELHATVLVIASEADSMPEQLYRAAGFEAVGHQRGLQRLAPA